MEPLVSIIMPNFNCAEYIGKTIQSVLNQTYKNFELIIIDDASTDNSVEVISAFKDERIRLVAEKKNEHICRATNKGLEYAKGSYIARVDSDDKWKPEKLEKQVRFLEENKEYGACFTWTDIIDQNDEIINDKSIFYGIFRQKNRSQEEWLQSLLFKGNCLCQPSVVFRRELLKELKSYKNSLLQLQDFDMWLRVLRIAPIYVLEEELTEYRRVTVENKSISAKNSVNDTRCYNETVCIYRSFLENMDDELFKRSFKSYFVNKASSTHLELECEKAFLLYSLKGAGKEAGVLWLSELIDRQDSRKVLEESFSFDCKAFYKINSEHYYVDDEVKHNNSVAVFAESAIYYNTVSDKDTWHEIKQDVYIRNGKLKCSFNIPPEADFLRFDPVDQKYCIVEDITVKSGEDVLQCVPMNGRIYGTSWVFEGDDPQIKIEKPESFEGLIDIEASIFAESSEMLHRSFVNISKYLDGIVAESTARQKAFADTEAHLNELIAAKENHIKNLEGINENNAENINALKGAVEAKDCHIENLNHEILLKEQHIVNIENNNAELRNTIARLENTISEMENTKVWKAYRMIKKN